MGRKNTALFPFGTPSVFQLFSRAISGSATQSLLNVQKLSLAANTAIATHVSVTDGFVVSGFGDSRDGLYLLNPSYGYFFPVAFAHTVPVDPGINRFLTQTGRWSVGNSTNGFVNADADSSDVGPWTATWIGAGITLTHPALQQLTTPSTALGGVFVLSGTQDGVYGLRGDSLNGRPSYNLLGYTADDLALIKWNGSQWEIYDTDTNFIYYSTSNVSTPDLASGWKDALDSPASITVTGVTQGQLASGLKIGTDIFQTSGSENGRLKYSDVLGVADPVKWSTDNTQWEYLSGPSVLNSGNVAFPFQGTPAVSVISDPVASEANWSVV